MNRQATIKNAENTIAAVEDARTKKSEIIDTCPIACGDPIECYEHEACEHCKLREIPDYPAMTEHDCKRRITLAQDIWNQLTDEEKTRLAAIPPHESDWRSVKDIKTKFNVSWAELKELATWAR